MPTVIIQVEKFPFSDLMNNSMREWLKFLGILVEEEVNRNDGLFDNSAGLERAEITNRIDKSDIRFYGRFIEPERLTDNYVDCAEFVYDVLKEQGYENFPSGDCIVQSKWYKAREVEALAVTGTDKDKIIVGDIILWAGKWENAKEYAHTGIVVKKEGNLLHIVNAGQQECSCDTEWRTYKERDDAGSWVQKYKKMEDCYDAECEKPSIWKSEEYFNSSTLDSNDHTFKYWARPIQTKE